jgi:hypothetical protein
MKEAATQALRAWRGPSLLLLLVLAATLLVFTDANAFAQGVAGWLREGFFVVYVDAAGFVSGCF